MIRLRHCETNVTVTCQNRCVGCNSFVPLQVDRFAASMIDPGDFERDLFHLSEVAHFEAYALIGGEPTLHPMLEEIVFVLADSGITDQIEVWSNGQGILSRVTGYTWTAIDRLVVSAYPGKISDENLFEIKRTCEAFDVDFELRDERGRRSNWMRLLEPEPTNTAVTQLKYERCWNKTANRVLDNGYFYRCCTSPFIPSVMQSRPVGSDGIAVAGLTEDALRKFLARDEFMESCRVCAGFSSGRNREHPLDWREVSSPDDWVRASSGQ